MPHAHNRFVAHVDILGMSSIVAKDPEAAWELLSALVAALDDINDYALEFTDIDEKVHIPNIIKSVTFSDTIVLFTHGSTDLDLRSLLVTVTALFHRALVRCVPVRVGVADGIFFFNLDKSMYAGPALIDAYSVGEASQWLGIVLSETVKDRALGLAMTSGDSNMVVPWDIPIKTGVKPGFVLNWPAALANDLTIEPPLSIDQFYQAFERTFGPIRQLPVDVQGKYDNTVRFANAHMAVRT